MHLFRDDSRSGCRHGGSTRRVVKLEDIVLIVVNQRVPGCLSVFGQRSPLYSSKSLGVVGTKPSMGVGRDEVYVTVNSI
jgi:hypothetical protein